MAQVIDLMVVYALAMLSLIGCIAAYGYWRYSGDETMLKALFAGEETRHFAQIAHVILYFSYFTLAHWYFGRTVGKWAVGLEVKCTQGQELDLPHAAGRTLAYFVSGNLTLGIGFLFPLFREDGKALHDLLAGTVVGRPVATAAERQDLAA